ncbi:MAG: antibiotic biosynthesis monooxygenase family protein, partial [Phycisphaeraceae bacterium]
MKFIFEVTVNPGYDPERYAAAWVEASRIIQQAPGAQGTYLHRDLNNPDRLLAIAHWESRAARDASDTMADPRVKAI